MRSMRVLERIWLDRSSTLTLQDQIARGIKELIQQGVLQKYQLNKQLVQLLQHRRLQLSK